MTLTAEQATGIKPRMTAWLWRRRGLLIRSRRLPAGLHAVGSCCPSPIGSSFTVCLVGHCCPAQVQEALRRDRSGRCAGIAKPLMILTAISSSCPPKRPWEPQMGANVFSRPRTQRDVLRIFTQVKGSPSDSDGDRRPEPPCNSLTRKRSLVQIQYGPRSVTWHFLSGSYQVALCGPALAL